ncbi:MAG: type IV pilus twitching motility protein PilT [Kiritimatiellae bacterium]|nr:type IV pilus twitching motility protein PilT [Kiritimatiellia bacterium]MBR1837465.1 type IV pilus twitching motility protein PilT [Kiritimatiellia bacterium]
MAVSPELMDQLLEAACDFGASDLHISVGDPPVLRVHGELTPLDMAVLEPQDTEILMRAICTEAQIESVHNNGGADFGLAFRDRARFRVSVFKQKGMIGIVLRQIPNDMIPLDKIGLPEEVTELLYKPRGLVLVTGPTGSGKTTTLASMLNFINDNRACHIITIEDPIEYYHHHKKSVVTQREIGADVPSFAEAIRRALRQDPDVILVGEMRDLETMGAAITAAETGHLVFGTLHTTGAASTVDRMVGAFPTDQQGQIRMQLSVGLVAVISQLLIPRIDKPGRVAAFEIMVNTPSIASMIRDGNTHRIISDIQTGAKYGMQTLDSHLLALYTNGMISYEEFISKSRDPDTQLEKIKELTGQG